MIAPYAYTQSEGLSMRIWQTTLLLAGAVTMMAACGDNVQVRDCNDNNVNPVSEPVVQLGPRPFFLVEKMADSPLKTQLQECTDGPFSRSDFSIGHRGAGMQFPEHTEESYKAAALMGAGILECDVTFTSDLKLVCRHSQCDLHQTTNILAVPELAAKCTQPFTPADPASGSTASAQCCTSDITLAEYKTLCGKMDARDVNATTVEEYLGGTANWRTDLYSTCGTLMTHAESIELFKELGVKMTPELKEPTVPMPFMGTYSQEDYAQQMIDEYKAAGVDPADVYPQSFQLDDVRYWIANEAEFAKNAVWLDPRYRDGTLDPENPQNMTPTMAELAAEGVNIIAPPMWALLGLDDNDQIVPSNYATAAKDADLDIITWTLERSGFLESRGGFYYQTIADVVDNDGDAFEALHVLAKDVGILGMFSDWPATVTYYANCMGLK